MRYSFLLLMLSSILKLNGQETATAESAHPEFRIGISASYDYCDRFIYADDTAGISQVFTYFRDNEISDFGFTGGIVLNYKFNERLSVEVLPRYSVNRYRTKDFLFIDLNGNQIGDGYIRYNNKFISIPIGIQYHLSKGKLSAVSGVYAIPEYALGIWTRGYYNLPPSYNVNEGPTKENIPELRSFMLSGMVNAGVEFRTGNLSIQALPNYKIGFLKQTKDVMINRRLWSAGLEIRILYAV